MPPAKYQRMVSQLFSEVDGVFSGEGIQRGSINTLRQTSLLQSDTSATTEPLTPPCSFICTPRFVKDKNPWRYVKKDMEHYILLGPQRSGYILTDFPGPHRPLRFTAPLAHFSPSRVVCLHVKFHSNVLRQVTSA